MSDKLFTPVNENAQQCVKDVLKYLSDITYEKILTGQHIQTLAMEEYELIKSQTGKEPALLGFELLSYSPNINYLDTDEECMKEVEENYGMLKRAWEWAEKKGLITFTWHWFSPLGGRIKSLFSRNTDFDASQAIIEGTPENRALMSDMDYMAGLLRPFADRHVPILWRPFHESEGDWFWWGAKGAQTARRLFQIMFDRFTSYGLHNLIWVWNSTNPETYPGDDYVDIVTRDMYPPAHEHTAREKEYEGMVKINPADKILAIGETGVLPDVDLCVSSGRAWAYYMTWSRVFCLSEEYNSYDYMRKLYSSEHAVTLSDLPKLYDIGHVHNNRCQKLLGKS